MIYLKGLNGIRAIAAIGVMISHIKMWSHGYYQSIGRFLQGPCGVTMFFALSGFLITYLLLKEKEKLNGNIAIRKFYFRRILRIWPLYFLYLLVSLVIMFIYEPEQITSSVAFYFILMANVPMALDTALPLIGHYWSLGTEEQFYLIWPWLVKTKNVLKTLIFFLAGFLTVKLFIHFIINNHRMDYFIDLLRFDCMAIGGLGAVLFYKNKITLLHNPIIQVICWLFVGAVAINRFHIISVIDHDIFAVVTTILVINQCSNEKVILSLDNKFCEFLGRISFGIYVYHPLVIFFLVKLFGAMNMEEGVFRTLVFYGAVFILTIFTAYISYEYYEKYFLKMRSKFAIVRSKNYKE